VADTPPLSSPPPVAGSELPGPYAVGEYAAALRARLRAFARVQLVGEIANLRPPTRARAYFELRDAGGAPADRRRLVLRRLQFDVHVGPVPLTKDLQVHPQLGGGGEQVPAGAQPGLHLLLRPLARGPLILLAGPAFFLAAVEHAGRDDPAQRGD